jgi:hypothetical protein
MAFPPQMQWDDGTQASDAPIADHTKFDVLKMLAGRWHKRRQK